LITRKIDDMFKYLILVSFILINFSNAFGQEIDTNKISNDPLLTLSEAVYLNKNFSRRGQFDFKDKRIGYLAGINASRLVKKEVYFKAAERDKTRHVDKSALIVFDAKEKEFSGGYDGMLIFPWIKLHPNKNAILKLVKAQFCLDLINRDK